jgi:cysteinyl-tRNA synthetase
LSPAAIRLELIKTHYRANADFSLQGLKDSARTVERWRQFAAAGRAGGAGETHSLTRDAVGHAMSDDLNIAGAIGAVNSWINATASPTLADAALFDQFDGIFGVASLKPLEQQSTGIAVYLPGTTPSDEVETLLAQRRDAKKAKDFAASDAIRDRLKAMGYAIKDMPGGQGRGRAGLISSRRRGGPRRTPRQAGRRARARWTRGSGRSGRCS